MKIILEGLELPPDSLQVQIRKRILYSTSIIIRHLPILKQFCSLLEQLIIGFLYIKLLQKTRGIDILTGVRHIRLYESFYIHKITQLY